jgi:putative chitinase
VIRFDRKVFFDAVRQKPFRGKLTQEQVDGMEFLLGAWEDSPESPDLRHFAYMLATTFWETARTMQPIEEFGKGAGHSYGRPDPETGQTYYGRGYVQLTWRDNYRRASSQLGLTGGPKDLEWHAEKALDHAIAWDVMSEGMMEGWFTGKKLPDYFNASTDNSIGARRIINPDDKGRLIAGFHADFLAALQAALVVEPDVPVPEPGFQVVHVNIQSPPGISVSVAVNGEVVLAGVG